MRFRGESMTNKDQESQGNSLHDMREVAENMAETMSLYRSAMHHIAEKQAATAQISVERMTAETRRRDRTHRMRLVLVPALGAALAAAVIAPAVGRLHHEKTVAVHVVQGAPAQTVASIDDTDLMNQIDSDLTQDVPDALQPLADFSSQPANTNQVPESKNVHSK